MRRTITVHRLGRVEYAEAHELQERLQRARMRGAIGDTLLLLEHPPVITLGRGAKAANILMPRALLEARGFSVHEIGRGGDVTYHGPGQITGYPILDLSPDRKDVRRYVSDLEELMIRLAGSYGLTAGRIDKLNGTWIRAERSDDSSGPAEARSAGAGAGVASRSGATHVDVERKIGAVGVRISRWVTMHGFAFNVNTDLSHFGLIVPCGITDKAVTSLERELGRPVPMDEALGHLESHFADIFDADLVRATEPPLSGVDESAFDPDPWRDARA